MLEHPVSTDLGVEPVQWLAESPRLPKQCAAEVPDPGQASVAGSLAHDYMFRN